MKSILEKYVESTIGMNVESPFHIETVQLSAVHDEYFSLSREKDGNVIHIPYANVVRIVENPEGVRVGGLFHQKKTYPVVVKIGHIVEYIPA